MRLKGLNSKYIFAVIRHVNVIIYLYFCRESTSCISLLQGPWVQLTMLVIWLAHSPLSVYFREKEKVLLMTNFYSRTGDVRSMLLVIVYSPLLFAHSPCDSVTLFVTGLPVAVTLSVCRNCRWLSGCWNNTNQKWCLLGNQCKPVNLCLDRSASKANYINQCQLAWHECWMF